MRILASLALLAAATSLVAADSPAPSLTASRAKRDFKLTADPTSASWRKVKAVRAAVDPFGKPASATDAFEFRTQWTKDNLYFFFSCPYDSLNLKPNPSTTEETNKLWDWDVTEIFVGSDFQTITHYQEFQVSPQSEWVDLDIDRVKPLPEGGWKWNSGMKVAARIDKEKKVWYGEMMIPFQSIDKRAAQPGNEFRINIYRLTGAAPKRTSTMWTPVNNRSHHTPEAFGRLVLGR
jgi:Carbohydrate family 9 binding domain-like